MCSCEFVPLLYTLLYNVIYITKLMGGGVGDTSHLHTRMMHLCFPLTSKVEILKLPGMLLVCFLALQNKQEPC